MLLPHSCGVSLSESGSHRDRKLCSWLNPVYRWKSVWTVNTLCFCVLDLWNPVITYDGNIFGDFLRSSYRITATESHCEIGSNSTRNNVCYSEFWRTLGDKRCLPPITICGSAIADPHNSLRTLFCVVLQSAACCWGSLHSSHHSGQLHSSPGSGGGTHSGGSLRSHCSDRSCSQACACGSGSSYCCGVWGIPANPHCHGLWLHPAPTWSPPSSPTRHLSELPGKNVWRAPLSCV